MHAKEAKAAFPWFSGIGQASGKADSIVIDRQPSQNALPAKAHADPAGRRMLLDVPERLLKNAEERQFNFGTKALREMGVHELHLDARPSLKLCPDIVHRGHKAQVLQDIGAQVVRDSLDLGRRLAEQLPELYGLVLRRSIVRGKLVGKRLAAKEDGTDELGDVVVKLEGDPPALDLLHLHYAVRQRP